MDKAGWLPVGMATGSAVIWGLWWIPIRWLEGLGLHGAWAGMAMNFGAFLAALIWIGLTGRRLNLRGRPLVGAMLVGVALSAYSIGLAYTDVVRAVLLFYLAPVWSKIIEWAFLNLPWRRSTTLALGAALLGGFLVLGAEIGTGVLNMGDLFSLLSGLAWAAGAALVFAGGMASAISLTVVTAFCAVLLALPLAVLSGAPTLGDGLALAMPAGLAGGAVYVLPIMALTLWSAQRLAPATITFLLTAEILSGVVSGALWSGEPFGWMQATGTVLIVLAALSEVLGGHSRRAVPGA
jgi:drug/metabolite transporter (DMT)-like permease